MGKILTGAMITIGLFLCSGLAGAEQAVVTAGKKVAFDYTLSVDGKFFETTQGQRPLEYAHGKGQLLPGLEKEMEGMKVGEMKTIMVPPEEGYGLIRKDAFQELLKDKFPKEMLLEVGTILNMEDDEGNSYRGIIAQVKKNSVVVNFNHRLAGKDLQFDVKIISIE